VKHPLFASVSQVCARSVAKPIVSWAVRGATKALGGQMRGFVQGRTLGFHNEMLAAE
jgi:hypothetical protein